MTIQKLIRFALIAAVILTAAVTSEAQESHIGKWTGHADAANPSISAIAGVATGFAETATVRTDLFQHRAPEFRGATYKCRSTPTGTLPTDQDIYDAIDRGLTNSNMPAWSR